MKVYLMTKSLKVQTIGAFFFIYFPRTLSNIYDIENQNKNKEMQKRKN